MPSIKLHGIYKVRAPQPCRLVEITIVDSVEKLNLSDVKYVYQFGDRDTIQVPFEEHFLSRDGETILGSFTYAWDHEDAWLGDVRLAFLMHYLEPGGVIETPYGNISVPKFTPRPARLKSLKYVSPY